MESIRLVVRTTKPQVKSYVFESNDEYSSWTIASLKRKLVWKYIRDADPQLMRIVYAGHILSDDKTISDILRYAECRDSLVLYLINLDEICNKLPDDTLTPQSSINSSDRCSENSSVKETSTNVISESNVSVDEPIMTDLIDEPIMTESVEPLQQSNSSSNRPEQVSNSSNVRTTENQFDVDGFYKNYMIILNRLRSDSTSAFIDLQTSHQRLLGVNSAFTNYYPLCAIQRFAVASVNTSLPQHSTRAANPGLYEAANQSNAEQIRMQDQRRNLNERVERRPIADMWDAFANRFRNQDALSNIGMILKISVLVCLLYLYEGTYRLLSVIAIVMLVYVAQRFGLGQRTSMQLPQR